MVWYKEENSSANNVMSKELPTGAVKTSSGFNSETDVLRLGQLRYSIFVFVITAGSVPLLYFLLTLPWPTSRIGAALPLCVLFFFTVFTRYAARGKFIRMAVIADHLVTLICTAFLVYFTGGALSPFNFFLMVPVMFGSFLVGKKFALGILGIVLTLIVSFLWIPNPADTDWRIKLTFVLVYAILIAYISYVLLFLRDMLVRLDRVRKAAQERIFYLEHITAQLKELDELKSEFVSRTSHQLLTPLNRMFWIIGTVLEGQFGRVSKKQQERLQAVHDNARMLIKLISDLLDLEKIEQEVRGAKRVPLKIADVISKILKNQKDAIKEKDLRVDFRGDSSITMVSDPRLMESSLGHIIDNAVRYNKKGGEVKLQLVQSDDKVVMTVEDTGIGIPVKDMPYIFKRFYRGENAARSVADGTGLGLAFAQAVIEKEGGKLSIESKENEWTKATISFPSQAEDTKQEIGS
ncbi:MAG: hypothetical protein A2748_02820 [Candidatus Wildermuthbacteria bacterium RIFCSPHIGHO2_01_FULL_45_20]|uniref:histidine kinase n=1 Tax=Candidatus Wildermuthbacteria bacterium RIFCSPHIGHO2_02_FULL_45_25 TaxID=1802450 RepID=A0A1G2R428_9BACT|nr:MAG: hypothetical protein A2748_02820 [Candidatus Wildermuthbacteria bacterium RIFCSPHIGHO2_01_FULL_45_20]OHA67576.1 MAG: hypothetical protein A3C04_00960 [Candidatus Wildermuthbacteria bacterium RIFCSPHIGHO2_02_FULL_45_25]